ncbi:unnamed protein product [Euphydryas editha]|nr:unnamed protein product [Euphydryas editha]
MHTFCEASERAFGLCIYLRSIGVTGKVQVILLCAKARIAPLKSTTIPRLELCSALLGAQLSSSATQTLRCKINRLVYWSDSKVTLGWIKSACKAKTFVANRVAAITELSDPENWRYVPTAENPADLRSRVVDPQNVGKADIWWRGPAFLGEDESSWPSTDVQAVELPEIKALSTLVVESTPSVSFIDVTRYSKLRALGFPSTG